MIERVYMVEQIEAFHQRMLSCHATYALAKAKVLRLIASMPKRAYPWTEHPELKRSSPNHGKQEMAWTSLNAASSTRGVKTFCVVSFEVQGSAIDRLAALVS